MIQLAHYSGNLLADGSLLPMDGDTLPDGSVPSCPPSAGHFFTPSLPLYPASFAPASQITCLQRAPPSNVAEGGTPPGGYPIHHGKSLISLRIALSRSSRISSSKWPSMSTWARRLWPFSFCVV